jgi:hypothetical protein
MKAILVMAAEIRPGHVAGTVQRAKRLSLDAVQCIGREAISDAWHGKIVHLGRRDSMLVRKFALVAPASTYLDGANLYAGHDGLRFMVRL